MAKGFKHGAGGGAGLNFKVVGNPQPENPKENTIWVNTDQKITGWIFSATEPTEHLDGMVWFLTSTFSGANFNALKKNGIQVYPSSAKQDVGGALVDVTAKIYQGGEWVEFNKYLFRSGSGAVVPLYTSLESGSILATIDTDYIKTTRSGSGGQMLRVGTESPIDLSVFSKALVEVKITSISASSYEDQKFNFGVSTEKLSWGASDTINKLVAKTVLTTTNHNVQMASLDVSALDGEYYVSIGGVFDSEIYNIWLE